MKFLVSDMMGTIYDFSGQVARVEYRHPGSTLKVDVVFDKTDLPVFRAGVEHISLEMTSVEIGEASELLYRRGLDALSDALLGIADAQSRLADSIVGLENRAEFHRLGLERLNCNIEDILDAAHRPLLQALLRLFRTLWAKWRRGGGAIK